MNLNDDRSSSKIIERIRSLLAMGQDTSSPNEAAIAVKRARKLMDEHQLSAIDIKNEKGFELGSVELNNNSTIERTWATTIAIAVAKMNDCIVRLNAGMNQNLVYVFYGFSEDAEACKSMTSYLIQSCIRLYERDKVVKSLSGLIQQDDYMTGISRGLCERLRMIISERELAMSETVTSQALVVAKKSLIDKEFGEVKYGQAKRSRAFDKNAFNKGKKASKEIHLGAFIGSSEHEDGIETLPCWEQMIGYCS